MGRMTTSQKEKIRKKVPGRTLKEKMMYLYLQNPERSTDELELKLAMTKDQVYGIKHIVKKELDGMTTEEIQEKKKSLFGEAFLQSEQLETQGSASSVSEDDLPGIEPVTINNRVDDNSLHSMAQMEALLPFDLGVDLNNPTQTAQPQHEQPLVQQQTQPSYTQPIESQPTQIQTTQSQNTQIQGTQTQAVQEIVPPPPIFDLRLSDVDGGTIKSFLSLIADKPTHNKRYTLELTLVEG